MKKQRGGFFVGMVIGLLCGLALSLGVALYVTKVPVPFVNKVPQRTPEQDAAEAERNRNWDPNTVLQGKTPAKPQATAPTAPAPATKDDAASAAAASNVPPGLRKVQPKSADKAAASSRDPAAILAGAAPSGGNTPATGAATSPDATPMVYYVQAGAYARTEEAEQQRAKLAMMGYTAKVTEREQSGRTVYRVRLGPFNSQAEADAAKTKLATGGVESALVRVQR
jgi:cell division protein FtsN